MLKSPFTMVAATYARHFPAVSFGPLSMWTGPAGVQLAPMHGANEGGSHRQAAGRP